jgi:hypothetical protein
VRALPQKAEGMLGILQKNFGREHRFECEKTVLGKMVRGWGLNVSSSAASSHDRDFASPHTNPAKIGFENCLGKIYRQLHGHLKNSIGAKTYGD